MRNRIGDIFTGDTLPIPRRRPFIMGKAAGVAACATKADIYHLLGAPRRLPTTNSATANRICKCVNKIFTMQFVARMSRFVAALARLAVRDARSIHAFALWQLNEARTKKFLVFIPFAYVNLCGGMC